MTISSSQPGKPGGPGTPTRPSSSMHRAIPGRSPDRGSCPDRCNASHRGPPRARPAHRDRRPGGAGAAIARFRELGCAPRKVSREMAAVVLSPTGLARGSAAGGTVLAALFSSGLEGRGQRPGAERARACAAQRAPGAKKVVFRRHLHPFCGRKIADFPGSGGSANRCKTAIIAVRASAHSWPSFQHAVWTDPQWQMASVRSLCQGSDPARPASRIPGPTAVLRPDSSSVRRTVWPPSWWPLSSSSAPAASAPWSSAARPARASRTCARTGPVVARRERPIQPAADQRRRLRPRLCAGTRPAGAFRLAQACPLGRPVGAGRPGATGRQRGRPARTDPRARRAVRPRCGRADHRSFAAAADRGAGRRFAQPPDGRLDRAFGAARTGCPAHHSGAACPGSRIDAAQKCPGRSGQRTECSGHGVAGGRAAIGAGFAQRLATFKRA